MCKNIFNFLSVQNVDRITALEVYGFQTYKETVYRITIYYKIK